MFTWTEIPRSAAARAHEHEARAAMYQRELEERAGMLLRLGHSPAFVKARLHANVAWDFSMNPRPSHAAEVDKIVDSVVRRQQGSSAAR